MEALQMKSESRRVSPAASHTGETCPAEKAGAGGLFLHAAPNGKFEAFSGGRNRTRTCAPIDVLYPWGQMNQRLMKVADGACSHASAVEIWIV